MAAVNPIMNNFNGGELSPLAYARVNLEKYATSVRTMENYVGQLQGGATRRPGTVYTAATKDTQDVRVVPFVFSDDDAFILEFGGGYIRFYKDRAQVLNLGVPYEISSPYTAAQVSEIDFVQSADVMYIVHASHAPRKLSRLATTNWTLTTVSFTDGPYLDTNSTAVTFAPAATSGTGVNITASAATFAATDVGRLIRIRHVVATVVTWGWARITAFTSTTVVVVTIVRAFGATTASADWRLGAWSGTTGYPEVAALVEDRLMLCGGDFEPFSYNLSRTGDYENFAPTEADGQVVDDNAIRGSIIGGNGAAGRVERIKWAVGDEKGIFVGTTGGEWVLRGSSLSEPITANNSAAKQITVHGSNDTKPTRVGGAVLFCQRTGRKVRELSYAFDVDGFKAKDITLLAEHLTKGRVREMAYQQEPHSLVWACLEDGKLIGLTYEREEEVFGWHRHPLGGEDAQVISIASIPSPDGTTDDFWLAVKRTIGGATVQYMERMAPFNTDFDAATEFFFVDCGVLYTNASAFTTVSGLAHLNGQTVAILADGAAHPDKVVSAGAVTLERQANTVAIGLPYTSTLASLRVEAGATQGTSQGKIKRINRMQIRVHQTVGLKCGPSVSKQTLLPFRSSANPMDTALTPFSGDLDFNFDGDYSREGYIVLSQDQPLPSTILGIFPEMVTYD